MEPSLKKAFSVSVEVEAPILVGQDDRAGRRQLIPVLGGEVTGEGLHGVVLPGGVDSQVIRPDGRCELSARYAVRLDGGESFYIENNGIRTVPPEYVSAVLRGEFIDPTLYYFCTTPRFEVYDSKLDWLMKKVFICCATRLPSQVIIDYYTVESN